MFVFDGCDVCVVGYEDGNFIGFMVFIDVKIDMDIYINEIFGFVLLVLIVFMLDDVIVLVNVNLFGNGVGLFMQSGVVVCKFQSEIDIGQVGINIFILVFVLYFSFIGLCGFKLGDLGLYGKQIVQFYM